MVVLYIVCVCVCVGGGGGGGGGGLYICIFGGEGQERMGMEESS